MIERPDNYRYSNSGEWVILESDNIAVVGVTDKVLQNLGNLVHIDFPELEENLEKNKLFGEIEGLQGLTDLFSPVNGEVVEINQMLETDFNMLPKDPFHKGWLVKLKLEDPGQVDDLLTLRAYEKHSSGKKR